MLIPFGILSAAASSEPAFAYAAYFSLGEVSNVAVTTVEKLLFSTESISTLATGLSLARRLSASMADAQVAGYVAGGDRKPLSDLTSTVDKFALPADTRSTLGTGLVSANYVFAGMANTGVAGYFGGGGSPDRSQVQKFTFPSDTRSTITSLSLNTAQPGAMANPAVAGYFGGGRTASLYTKIDKYAFPSDTRSTLGTGLTTATHALTGLANAAVAGYFGGGQTSGGFVTTVQKFTFPGDSRSTLGTGLSIAREFPGGASNSGTAGYFGGGNNNTTVDKFAFPSDTRTTLATGLSNASAASCAFASENI